MIELVLGLARAFQILLSLLLIALSSSSINSLPSHYPGLSSPTTFSLLISLWSFLALVFLVTSQFLFVGKYDGYSTYLSIATILEVITWTGIFASWISVAQLGFSCDMHLRSCQLNKPLLGFMFINWLIWSVSLVIIGWLKWSDSKRMREQNDIEERIKKAVEMT